MAFQILHALHLPIELLSKSLYCMSVLLLVYLPGISTSRTTHFIPSSVQWRYWCWVWNDVLLLFKGRKTRVFPSAGRVVESSNGRSFLLCPICHHFSHRCGPTVSRAWVMAAEKYRPISSDNHSHQTAIMYLFLFTIYFPPSFCNFSFSSSLGNILLLFKHQIFLWFCYWSLMLIFMYFTFLSRLSIDLQSLSCHRNSKLLSRPVWQVWHMCCFFRARQSPQQAVWCHCGGLRGSD